MTNLTSQRRLAAKMLKVGKNRVWIDPDRIEDVDVAMTRDDIRKLIHEGVIKAHPIKGISRGRARALHEIKKKGLRRGPGSRTGSKHARISRKEIWMNKIRALRINLRKLKSERVITIPTYRKMYGVVGSGRFDSVADLQRYLKLHELWRSR